MMKPKLSSGPSPALYGARYTSMSKAFHLGSYEDVKKHAAAIYERIRGIGGPVMPPHRQEAKVHGRDLTLNYSLNGWPTGFDLSFS
jgi:hypothetical protein